MSALRPLVPLGIGPNYCPRCYARAEAPNTPIEKCWACRYWGELDGVIPITYLTVTAPARIGSDIRFTKSAPEREHIPYIAATFHKYLDLHGERIWRTWGITTAAHVPAHKEKIASRGFDLMGEIVSARPDNRKRFGFRPLLQQLSADEQPPEGRIPRASDWTLSPGVDLRGARLLLADDVITSGATAVGIARMARAHGAEAVYVLSITRAVGQRVYMDLWNDLGGVPFDWAFCPIGSEASAAARNSA